MLRKMKIDPSQRKLQDWIDLNVFGLRGSILMTVRNFKLKEVKWSKLHRLQNINFGVMLNKFSRPQKQVLEVKANA